MAINQETTSIPTTSTPTIPMTPQNSSTTSTIPKVGKISDPTDKRDPSQHISKEALSAGAKFEGQYADALIKRQHILNRYDSINGMKHDEKLEALKDLKVNPFMLDNGYDGLVNSLHRWSQIASGPEAQKLSPEAKNKVASNYYKTMIAPMYEKMKASPIDEKLWMDHAYGAALKYDINKAYGSHWRQGLYAGFKDWENLGKFTIASLGGTVSRTLDFVGAAATGKLDEYGKTYKGELDKYGSYGSLVHETEQLPILGSTYKSLDRVSREDGFWRDINPNEHWYQGLASFVTEQAFNLPLYKITGFANEGMISSIGGANLTKSLVGSTGGKLAAALLTNGAEGLAYGYAQRDDDDKANAWQDAIGQMVLGTTFHIAGERFKHSGKLGEELKLASAGIKEGTADNLEGAIIKSTAGNLAAGGVPLQSSIFREALNFIRSTEGTTKEYIHSIIASQIKSDPARYQPIHEAGSYIRALLGDKKLSELKPEELATLNEKLNHLMKQSQEQAPALVKEMKEASIADNLKIAKSKEARGTIDRIAKALELQDQRAGIKSRGEKVYFEIASKQYAIQNAKGQAKAAAENAKKTVQTALDAEARKALYSPEIKSRTTYRTNKAGEPSVSFSLNPEWKAYAKKAAKDKGFGSDLKEWLSNLSSDEFVRDLKDYFYPKQLKEAGVYFEHETNREGKQDPNFLAFMLNYRATMPKEMGDRIAEELEDTLKVEHNFNPKIPIEQQLEHYAKGMRNHVQDFIQSERHLKPNVKGEVGNIYRTTYSNLTDPSRFQEQLHMEVIEREEGIIKKMYKNPENRSAALNAYRVLASQRKAALKAGDQDAREAFNEVISDMFTEGGKYERWDF